MKYLQIINAVFAALGTTMLVTLGVVWILYAVYVGDAPQLRGEMQGLVPLIAWFAGLALAAGAAFLSQRRVWAMRWIVQLTPLLPLAGVVMYFASLRG